MISPSVLFVLLSASPRRLEVCMSPGCVADGAQGCLDKLQALTPFDVQKGGCVSLCGKGPVVIVPEDDDTKRQILYKRVKGDALMKLLEEDFESTIPIALVEGYDLVSQAHELVAQKKHDMAIPLYQKGIDMAMETAKTFGGSVVWLSKALRSLALSHLTTSDASSALQSICQALELDDKDPQLWECKVEICQALKDTADELKALQKYFSLPVSPDPPPRDVANRRRTLGFRLQKLEREVQGRELIE